MRSLWTKQRNISRAERGHIIQRILVDGWTIAEAAAHLDVTEWRIRRWVVQYRHRGMASLRRELSAETLPQRWMAWMRSRLAPPARANSRIPEPAPCIELRRSGDERKRI
jgi:transposase-like protein